MLANRTMFTIFRSINRTFEVINVSKAPNKVFVLILAKYTSTQIHHSLVALIVDSEQSIEQNQSNIHQISQ